ncbi:uncharacterized protein LOC129908799 [Episyrphus balteatus]|uniref:uncharacterized protein LOC129908799 n=1 Tax=Episyrphus balteatus TaxID=286459 RepID=UPI00248690C0|nr:uncharacterized protein LOC129908799 [Episyrphus balteatus]
MDQESMGERHQFYLITLLTKNPDLIMEHIFQYCLIRMITNINVLIDVKDVIKIYTFFPFNEKKCRDSSPKIYNIFKNGEFLWSKSIFPSKFKNLWQCPLNMILWILPPNIKLDYTDITKPKVFGIDGDTLNIFAKAMNFSFSFTDRLVITSKFSDSFKIVSKRPYRCINRLFQYFFRIYWFVCLQLQQHKADLLIGSSFCSKERFKLYSYSYPYIPLPEFIIIKIPTIFTYLGTLLYPFDRLTWSILIGLFIGQKIIKIIYKNIKQKFYGHKFTKRPFIILWLMAFIVIRSSYEGLIFKSLKENRVYNLPQNIEEVVNDGYNFFTNLGLSPFIIQIPGLQNNTIYVDAEKLEMIEEFVKSKENKYALILGDIFAELFKNVTVNYDNYFMFKRPIFVFHTSIYFPKTSALQAEFQNRLMQLFNHGHLEEISKGYSLKELFKNSSGKHKINAMSLKQFRGVFDWFAIFYGLGICLFVLELLSKK